LKNIPSIRRFTSYTLSPHSPTLSVQQICIRICVQRLAMKDKRSMNLASLWKSALCFCAVQGLRVTAYDVHVHGAWRPMWKEEAQFSWCRIGGSSSRTTYSRCVGVAGWISRSETLTRVKREIFSYPDVIKSIDCPPIYVPLVFLSL
jgi:hypothetical protein